MRRIGASGVALLSLAAFAQGLGPPLVRDGPPDVGVPWRLEGLPKSAPTRDGVVSLFESNYVPQGAVPLAWTGSLANCNPGSTNLAHQQAVIGRVNYFRALVGLPAVSLLTGTEAVQAQAAALLMSANNALSHAPPMTWACYSMPAATGAGNSNIALGNKGVDAVDAYMTDSGSNNSAAGHRRWILYPPVSAMATGDIPGGNTPPFATNALYVFGPTTTRPATPNGIAWPPAGYVPYQNLPAASNRWSISYPGADFTNAGVTMTGPGGPIPVTYEPLNPPFPSNSFIGDNTLVFLPNAVPYQKPAADTTYTIVVSNIGGANVPSTLQYTVTVIDPAAAAPAPTSVVVVEFYNASLDHYFISWGAAEIANLDAGRTPTRWTRTGFTFTTSTALQPGASPVCRYYIPPGKGDSHFFGRGIQECTATGLNNPDFVLEEANYMFMYLPTAGSCPAGTVPIYRVFSNRPDANHRYVTDPSVRDMMAGLGWLAEGDGPDLVVMCAPA
ncbi:MAG: CAP domain-containing protein [Casimicrobiaceae bacterium]